MAGFQAFRERQSGRNVVLEFGTLAKGAASLAFMRKYGHLRPGSAIFCPLSYATGPNFRRRRTSGCKGKSCRASSLRELKKKDLGLLINEYGLATNPDALLEYARRAMPGANMPSSFSAAIFSDILVKFWPMLAQISALSATMFPLVEIQSFLDWAESAWPGNAAGILLVGASNTNRELFLPRGRAQVAI